MKKIISFGPALLNDCTKVLDILFINLSLKVIKLNAYFQQVFNQNYFLEKNSLELILFYKSYFSKSKLLLQLGQENKRIRVSFSFNPINEFCYFV